MMRLGYSLRSLGHARQDQVGCNGLGCLSVVLMDPALYTQTSVFTKQTLDVRDNAPQNGSDQEVWKLWVPALRFYEELGCCNFMLTTNLRSRCIVLWASPTLPPIPPGLIRRNGYLSSCIIRGQPRTSQHSQVELSILKEEI